MDNFPALHNGSDVFNNIAGIPADLVDHIDFLPGGQSSLYGSDAIAGVINIVLKDHVDAPSIDVRVGGYSSGGGSSRVSGAGSWKLGKLNLLAGFQYDAINPLFSMPGGEVGLALVARVATQAGIRRPIRVGSTAACVATPT